MGRRPSAGLSGMSITQLQAELRRRGRRAKTLRRRRDRLAARLAKLDHEIMMSGGSAGLGGGRVRPRNATNLAEALHKVLNGKTMGVTEVAEAVQRAGYRTGAENFRTIVNQCLIKNKKVFKKVRRGQYTAA